MTRSIGKTLKLSVLASAIAILILNCSCSMDNGTAGFTVTTCCKNPDIAFKFINDILTEEIMDYRFWGIEGVDYLVDADGNCYRTQEMTENWSDVDYGIKHVCQYLMMPQS